MAVHPGCAFFFLVPAHALCFITTCNLSAPLVTPDLVVGGALHSLLNFARTAFRSTRSCVQSPTAGRQKQLSSWARMQQAVLSSQSCSGVAGMASCRRTLSLRRQWRRRGSPSWARRRPPWSSSASSTRRVPSPRTPRCAVTFSFQGADRQQQRNQMRCQNTEQHLEGTSAAQFGRAGRQLRHVDHAPCQHALLSYLVHCHRSRTGANASLCMSHGSRCCWTAGCWRRRRRRGH